MVGAVGADAPSKSVVFGHCITRSNHRSQSACCYSALDHVAALGENLSEPAQARKYCSQRHAMAASDRHSQQAESNWLSGLQPASRRPGNCPGKIGKRHFFLRREHKKGYVTLVTVGNTVGLETI